jgi:Flp pilus assembly pilin Flp
MIYHLKAMLVRLWKEEEGQDLVEYSLLLAFIALAAVALLSGVKGTIRGLWTSINSTLTSASSAS